MSYSEPRSLLGPLSLAVKAGREIFLEGERGVQVSVQYVSAVGWCIEVRYDLGLQSVARQPFTGVQADMERAELTAVDAGDSVHISIGTDVCVMQKGTASFTLARAGRVYFQSHSEPFTAHSEPVKMFENLMSLKVTDYAQRAPFTPEGKLFDTRMVRFRYPRPEGLVLGLPGQSGEMNRNGYRFELYNTDEFLHLPSPKPLSHTSPLLFHKASEGDGWVGLFHDNPSRTQVDIGDFYPDLVTFESATGNTRVVIAAADSLADTAGNLARLTGSAVFPPLWAFGYQQSRWSYMSSKEVRSVAQKMRAKRMPCDALHYDIDYMDGFRVFTKNEQTFGDLAVCVRDLRQQGIRSVCIVDPGVKYDEQYDVCRQLLALKGALLHPDGSPFIIKCWPGKALLPDFGDEAVRQWWSDLQKDWMLQYGFDGVWNDMNEPSNFDGGNAALALAQTKRGSFANECNLYGYYMAHASKLGCDKAHPGKRSFVITRSGYPGVQRFAVAWHGDNQAWWEHLRWALDTCMLYSLGGAYYTGADVPGFTGNPSDDLAVRFFQLGAFLPFFRGHSIYFAKDKEPYAYGKRATVLIRKAVELRYSLLREWYSGFEQAVRTATPPLLPVVDAAGVLVRDHVLLFDKFLVAPVMERDQTRKLVYLPEGEWYAFGKPKRRIRGGRWMAIAVRDATIPIYVRAGSIVTRNTVGMNTEATLASPESFDVYPDAAGSAKGYWYGDDGESLQDVSARREQLTWDVATATVTRRAI